MKSFTHDQIQKILRSEQKLSNIEQDAFSAHIAQCSECQLYASIIKEFSRAVPKMYSTSILSVPEIRQKAQASKHLLWRRSVFTRMIHGTTSLVWLGATLVILLILGFAIPQLIPISKTATSLQKEANPTHTPSPPPTNTPLATATSPASSFLSAASDLIQKGQIDQGIQTYKEAVKADPRNPDIYVSLARWQVLAGDYAGAAESIPNALLLNPNHALAHAVMGWVKGKQGDFRNGQAEIQKSLDLDPNNALAYAYLAEIYTDMIEAGNDDPTALDQLGPISQKALALDSSLLEVRRARGLALAVTGKHQEAITEFEAAVAINGYLPELHLALGRSYSAAEIYDRAEAEYRRAIELKPDTPTAYAELARMYLKMGEFTNGISYARQAVQKDTADPYLHSLVGTLYYKSGDLQSAITSLSLAVNGGMTGDGVQVNGIPLDRSPETINLYSRYGLALATTGQCDQALQVAKRISEVAPEDESARYNAQVMQDTCRGQAGYHE